MKNQLEKEKKETLLIINELLADNSDPDAIYLIEHHLSCENIENINHFLKEILKYCSFDFSEIEQIEVQEDLLINCIDLLSEIPLDANLINQQIEQILLAAEKFNVNYDGWGTFFEAISEQEE